MVQHHEMKMIIRLSDNSKVQESVCVEEERRGHGGRWERVVVVGVGGVGVQEILKVVGMVMVGEVEGVV